MGYRAAFEAAVCVLGLLLGVLSSFCCGFLFVCLFEFFAYEYTASQLLTKLTCWSALWGEGAWRGLVEPHKRVSLLTWVSSDFWVSLFSGCISLQLLLPQIEICRIFCYQNKLLFSWLFFLYLYCVGNNAVLWLLQTVHLSSRALGASVGQ